MSDKVLINKNRKNQTHDILENLIWDLEDRLKSIKREQELFGGMKLQDNLMNIQDHVYYLLDELQQHYNKITYDIENESLWEDI